MLNVKSLATCSTRGGSQGRYIMFASAMRIRQPTLAVKPRGDVTRNPKQGYQWPQNRTCVCVRQKYLKKKIYKRNTVKLDLQSALSPLASCYIFGGQLSFCGATGTPVLVFFLKENIHDFFKNTHCQQNERFITIAAY